MCSEVLRSRYAQLRLDGFITCLFPLIIPISHYPAL
jgi:hypothetical protein